MKPCRSPLGGFVKPTNTSPTEIPFNLSTAKCCSCFYEAHISCTPTVGPVFVSSSAPIVQPSPHTNLASPPVANDNPPEFSVPMEEETFPSGSTDSTLLSLSQIPETVNSPICSFNTAVSSTSYIDHPIPAHQTVIRPSRPGFSKNNLTPTKTVTQQPLLNDAVPINASLRMMTLSPKRRSDHKCPRLLRSSTVNERHDTAQEVLNKQLAHQLKNEMELKQRQTWDPVVTRLKKHSLHHKRLHATVDCIANSIAARLAKKRFLKRVASSRQTTHEQKKLYPPLHRHH